MQEYWRKAVEAKVPWALQAISADPEAHMRIPLKIFGDEATFNLLGDQCLGFVLSCPLWRPNAGRNSRWTFAVLLESRSLGFATWEPLLARMTWSLNIAHDHGTAGLKFQVTEIEGDWKFLRQVFQLRTHWNSKDTFCHCCRLQRDRFASLPDVLPFRSTAQFIREVLPDQGPQCSWILLRGFDVSTIQWCQLHVLNLGLLWTSNGGTIDFLLEQGFFGPVDRSQEAQLESAFDSFEAWQATTRNKCSQRKFTPKMLWKKSHGAYLTTKGWNARVIAAWLAHVLSEALDTLPQSEELTLTAHAVKLGRIYKTFHLHACVIVHVCCTCASEMLGCPLLAICPWPSSHPVSCNLDSNFSILQY